MPLATTPLPLVFTPGRRFYKSMTWNDANGDPVDLTGKKAKLEVRYMEQGEDVLLTLSTEVITKDGTITLGGASGLIEMEVLASALPTTVTWSKAVYDLVIYTTTDDAQSLVGGPATIERGVTSV